MKLRNFMYATMIACAFASCSKDEVIDGDQPAKGDTSLTINVGVKTKSVVATEGQPETTINDLNIFVMAANGSVLDSKYLSEAALDNENATTTVTFEGLAPQDGVYCIGFANIGEVKAEELTTKTYGLTAAANATTATSLPMHGVSEAKTLTANTTTTLTIDLVRDLARVELNSIQLNTKYSQGDFEGDFVKATAGTVSLTFQNATINHAASGYSYAITTTPSYKSEGIKGEAFVGGLQGWKWSDGSTDYVNGGTALDMYKKSGSTYFGSATQDLSKNEASNLTKPTEPAAVVFYVLPADVTVLTLQGEMVLKDVINDGIPVADATMTSYYNVEIGKTGTIEPGEGISYNAGDGIVANTSYTIDIIAIGKGSNIDGGKPTLVVNTKVRAWENVHQIAPVK